MHKRTINSLLKVQYLDLLIFLLLLLKNQPKSPHRRTGVRASNLLQVREFYDNLIPFKGDFQRIRISQYVVWKYSEADKIGNGALEHIHVDVHTRKGQTETDVLLIGSLNGSLSCAEVGKVRPNCDYGVKWMPDLVWLFNKNGQADCGTIPGPICRPVRASLAMSSNVSCIKFSERGSNHGKRVAATTYPKSLAWRNINEENTLSSKVSKELKDPLMQALIQVGSVVLLKVLIEAF
ncbi:uncharacterized protein LOC121258015 [Juglans microcarpa x Juglans regia]|uniref:uncharacterized protein LOC121258015 n=1 Tax=Juglans microcarpa x Juglans regia TaxID=2249226 RepID=UPI001B7F0FEE|nr:uncharacterized protein LOC121258015 [Juglans microcarpa x Juglans regia]